MRLPSSLITLYVAALVVRILFVMLAFYFSSSFYWILVGFIAVFIIRRENKQINKEVLKKLAINSAIVLYAGTLVIQFVNFLYLSGSMEFVFRMIIYSLFSFSLLFGLISLSLLIYFADNKLFEFMDKWNAQYLSPYEDKNQNEKNDKPDSSSDDDYDHLRNHKFKY
jgi:hypothetical protein